LLMSEPVSPQKLFFTIATAGHVDHGKTSVIKALTGTDPDRLKEEKERQMTTDLGFAHLRVAGKIASIKDQELIVGFIDVPGHGKFLKNMLAGVGGIDLALFVVASDEGPMPQTIQHAKILSLLGIEKALVVLTKTDLAQPRRQDEVALEVEQLLGRYKIACVDMVRVSFPQHKGFDQLADALACNLAEHVHRSSPNHGDTVLGAGHESISALAYLPIDRVFSKSGYGVVVTGTLVRGSISVGNSIFIEPGGQRGRVRGLETFGHSVQTAHAGQRLAVNVALKENKPLVRGQAIFGTEKTPSKTLIVSLTNPDREGKSITEITGQSVRVYHGTAECQGQMRFVEAMHVHNDGIERFVGYIALSDPLVAEPAERYVIRYGDEGLAGGSILLTARPRWLTRPKLVQLTQLIMEERFAEAVLFFIDESPQRMLKEEALQSLLPLSEHHQCLSNLLGESKLVKIGDFHLTAHFQSELSEKLLKHLAVLAKIGDLTERQAQSSLENVRKSLSPGLDRTVFQQLLRDLMDAGKVVRNADRVSLKDASTGSIPSDVPTRLREELTRLLGEHPCLELDELAKLSGSTRKEINHAMQALANESVATIVNYDYASLNSTLQEAHELLSALWQKKKDISPSEFKEGLSISRKYAMALLVHFDDQRITRRVGTGRVLLKPPANKSPGKN
jgi:selenocysteine-specific elongation factor